MKIFNGNRVVTNAIWIVGCKLFKAALRLFITMMTARYLGPSNYGLINYAASIVTFITPIVPFIIIVNILSKNHIVKKGIERLCVVKLMMIIY